MKRALQLTAILGVMACVVPLAAEEHWHEERPLPEPRVLEFLERHMPHMLPELRQLREHEPDIYRREIREIGEHVRELQHIGRIAPNVAEAMIKAQHLEHQSHVLAGHIARVEDGEEREELTARLRDVIEKIFDLRLKEREFEITQLENEIEEIKHLIERRREAKQKIVERRLRDLVTDADEELSWW